MEAVLLVNLGTPDAPTPPAVRRYLKAFLSDRRVIQMSPLLWQPILRLMILPTRPKKSAATYQKIWTDQGSPLKDYTQRQTAQLQAIMPEHRVYFAMSYSDPQIETVLDQIVADHATKLTVIPLYPQYSTTTVASVLDTVHRYFAKATYMPELHLVSTFCRRADYLDALAARIETQLAQLDADYLLFSYHGIPQSYADQGDVYATECQQTTEGVCARLNLAIPHSMAYQSKFGPAPWLTPATIDVVKDLPAKGFQKVAVVTPSFVSDCLETIYEIGIENRDAFQEAGGETLTLIKPFNDDPGFAQVLKSIVVGTEK